MNAAVLWLTLALLTVGILTHESRLDMPNAISIGIALLAGTTAAMEGSAAGWLSAAAGLLVGFICGGALWRAGGCGSGDAKALGALGALVGIDAVIPLLVCVAVAGGGLAVVALLRGERDLAYAPAITMGFFLFVIARGAL